MVNEYQHTNVTNNSNILVYVGSNITLQCTCDNDIVQCYYNEKNISGGTFTLDSAEQLNSSIYTCKGQIQNVSYNINITVYSK